MVKSTNKQQRFTTTGRNYVCVQATSRSNLSLTFLLYSTELTLYYFVDFQMILAIHGDVFMFQEHIFTAQCSRKLGKREILIRFADSIQITAR